ncbi:MAG: antibiotic biosynthesis monooxygenase [Vicinamibacteria bacterium]
MAEEGATVVITHRVRAGQEAAYERWLEEIEPVSRASAGQLDWQIVRPVPGLTTTYTVVIRFDTGAHLEGWMKSDERRRLIEKARPILEVDDDFRVRSGLEFWFAPDDAPGAVPVRWKQVLVSWSAIYPLVIVVPLAVRPLASALGLPVIRLLDTLIVTGIISFLMAYVVMPRYSRLFRRWLFR